MALSLLDAALLAAAATCGLIGGCFFAFSTFVMKALRRLPASQGIAAMQSINVAVINPWFLAPFVGGAVLCAAVAAAALLAWRTPGAGLAVAGAVLYVGGTFLVTMLLNVPLNDALARLPPESPEAAAEWARYCSAWTAWNHVRTAAAVAAALAFTFAFRLRS
jgi:uncharacterized membrane protein